MNLALKFGRVPIQRHAFQRDAIQCNKNCYIRIFRETGYAGYGGSLWSTHEDCIQLQRCEKRNNHAGYGDKQKMAEILKKTNLCTDLADEVLNFGIALTAIVQGELKPTITTFSSSLEMLVIIILSESKFDRRSQQ